MNTWLNKYKYLLITFVLLALVMVMKGMIEPKGEKTPDEAIRLAEWYMMHKQPEEALYLLGQVLQGDSAQSLALEYATEIWYVRGLEAENEERLHCFLQSEYLAQKLFESQKRPQAALYWLSLTHTALASVYDGQTPVFYLSTSRELYLSGMDVTSAEAAYAQGCWSAQAMRLEWMNQMDLLGIEQGGPRHEALVEASDASHAFASAMERRPGWTPPAAGFIQAALYAGDSATAMDWIGEFASWPSSFRPLEQWSEAYLDQALDLLNPGSDPMLRPNLNVPI